MQGKYDKIKMLERKRLAFRQKEKELVSAIEDDKSMRVKIQSGESRLLDTEQGLEDYALEIMVNQFLLENVRYRIHGLTRAIQAYT